MVPIQNVKHIASWKHKLSSTIPLQLALTKCHLKIALFTAKNTSKCFIVIYIALYVRCPSNTHRISC